MKTVCDVCGNKRDSMSLLCPFCGSKSEAERRSKVKKPFVKKIINLEAGRPVAEHALQRMTEAIQDSTQLGVTVLVLIHGYGSTGQGGVIRTECRKMLQFMQSKGVIQDYIHGEDYSTKTGSVKELLRRYPQLKNDRNLNKANKGITLVILV